MTAKTMALSSVILIMTAAAAFATCNGKQRISCAEGSIYDHSKGACVTTQVSS